MDKDTCKKCQVEINDLPNELLTKIFACLSLKHDLDNVQQVSTRWYSVVDQTIGREIAVTSITSDKRFCTTGTYPSVPYAHMGCLEFDMISKLGVKICYIDLSNCYACYQGQMEPEEEEDDDFEDKNCSSSPPTPPQGPTQLKPFKYPHLLKQLYINASIRPDLFQYLLKDTLNLTMMQINTLALSQLTPENLKNIKLPLLKALGIGKCMKPYGRNFDDTVGLPNLQIFLEENHFPRLRQLDLRFSVENFKDFRTISAILKFLGVHIILEELSVIMEFPIQVNLLRNYYDELESTLTLAKSQACKCCHLKICEIQGIRLHASYPQLKIWKVFLQQQRSLQSLTLRLGHLSPPLLEEISVKNGSTLEYIFLYKLNEILESDNQEDDGRAQRVLSVLDCNSFSGAKKLEILYALGCDVVVNSKNLPKSLGTLFLNGVICTEDVEYLLLGHPKLQFISLKGACMKREGCGVTLNLLKKFIEKRKVNRLVLNGPSLSENYPKEGLSNGNPTNPEMLIQFDNWDPDHVYLDWELSRDKYYIDKCY